MSHRHKEKKPNNNDRKVKYSLYNNNPVQNRIDSVRGIVSYSVGWQFSDKGIRRLQGVFAYTEAVLQNTLGERKDL